MKKVINSHYFFITLLFILLTAIFFYPLSLQFQTHINDNHDSLFLVWTFSWWKHILTASPADFLNSNALYPDKLTLAYSTFMYAKVPFFLLFDLFFNNKIASYNITVFSSFIISGLAAYSLIYYYTKNKLASFFAAFIYAFSPIKSGRISLAQVLNLEYMPLSILFLEKFFAARCKKDLIFFTLFSLLQILSEGYVAFIYASGMVIFVVFRFGKKICNKLFILSVSFQALISMLFYSPYLYLYFYKPSVFKKELILSMGLSTLPQNLFSLPWDLKNSLIDKIFKLPSVRPDTSLYLGILPVILCIFYFFIRSSKPKFIWYFLLFIYIILSFGPYWVMQNGEPLKLPYYYFWKLIPGFSIMRSTGRFSLGAVLPVAVISGFAMAYLFNLFKSTSKKLAILLCGIILASDNFFLPFNSEKVVPIPQIYHFLKTQKRGAVFEFPFHTQKDFFIDQANYFSTVDFFPRVMSYSSSYSETFHYFKFLERTDQLYSDLLIKKLKEIKVPYILVHKQNLAFGEAQKFIKLIKTSNYQIIKSIDSRDLYLNKSLLPI